MWCLERIAWLAKKAIRTDGSISRNDTTAKTATFAQSTGSRLGTAPIVARIIPVEYSPVITSTPRTPIASCASVDAGERDVERVAVGPLVRAHAAPVRRGHGGEESRQADRQHDGDEQRPARRAKRAELRPLGEHHASLRHPAVQPGER